MAGVYQVIVTASCAEEADRLGRSAVEKRLAACAQVWGPVASTYWWEGEVKSASEFVCVLKTTAGLVDPLVEALQAAHSYEVPEILASPVDSGNAAYLGWIAEETRPGL
jgi:periplasmic divalent cation tolerance protein